MVFKGDGLERAGDGLFQEINTLKICKSFLAVSRGEVFVFTI